MFGELKPINMTNAFDIQRLLMTDSGDPPAIQADRFTLLHDAQSKYGLQPDTNLLITQSGEYHLAFITLQMVYYHVAQGQIDNEAWMLSFCAACNGGMLFSPVVKGRELHFDMGGMYNAMLLLRDTDTGSYWNHITGECVHGTLVGERLRSLAATRHMRLSDALAQMPNARLVYAQDYNALPTEEHADIERWDGFRSAPEHPYIEHFAGTMGQEDTRLPRLDMGLGVWTAKTQRYYSMSHLYMRDNVLIDTFDGRKLLVYIDPASGNPSAFFTTAANAERRGDDLILDNGDRLRGSTLQDRSGMSLKPEQPTQLFMRWYGFAFIFPGCEIYGRRDSRPTR
ncbi:MAG: DUF3179 domain-containing (seleno)protein [Chloroflexota bacterium]|nr:DUF3179 domain-containing (seleno)protein [Chloroflexota bacterium]